MKTIGKRVFPPDIRDNRSMFLFAARVARQAHGDQRDKTGMKYILHPMRLALRIIQRGDGYRAATVAMLHDVVEDTPATFGSLRRLGFPGDIVAAVEALSRKRGESNSRYIKRVQASHFGKIVKRADLADNLRTDRAPSDPGYTNTRRMYRQNQAMLS